MVTISRAETPMTPWKCCVLLLGLMTLSAKAQDAEQLTIEKNRGLTGLWRIEVPDFIRVAMFGSTTFGPMRQTFCRIEENLEIHCLAGGFSQNGAVTLEGDAVHIAWGSMMARFVIDGTRDGDSVSGTFAIKVSGISHDAPGLSHGVRFHRDTTSMPGGDPALAARLLTPEGRQQLPRTTDALGALEQLKYLGHSPNLNGTGGDDYFSVYDLEFAGGERVCGLRADDSAMPRFKCF
jgi:hypothetical protein